jgi:D-glycero-alpha-D-manno-heptose 1-phosphate guanylyltransferase
MEAVVLAGGLGTRLRDLVPNLPKPMATISGRPFLEILLVALAEKGFDRVVVSLGHMAPVVVSHFGEKFSGMDLAYEIEPTPLGTGGALRRALGRCEADHVFVLNGDTYLDLEIGEVEAQWQRDHVPLIIATEVADTTRYGRLKMDGRHVVGFVSKGVAGPGLINAGCYVFPKDIARKFPVDEVFSLENDFLAQAAADFRFDCFVSRGVFIDIGVPDDYIRAQSELARVCR